MTDETTPAITDEVVAETTSEASGASATWNQNPDEYVNTDVESTAATESTAASSDIIAGAANDLPTMDAISPTPTTDEETGEPTALSIHEAQVAAGKW